MRLFSFFRKRNKSADERPELDGAGKNLHFLDNFSNLYSEPHAGDGYLYNAWVNIAVNILIRNIARADFTIKKKGDDVTSGPLCQLFKRPNSALSRFDLWKETAAWWHLEGEAFWWFGPDYAGGCREQFICLIPGGCAMRKLRLGDWPALLAAMAGVGSIAPRPGLFRFFPMS
jgi:hypothetical protein